MEAGRRGEEKAPHSLPASMFNPNGVTERHGGAGLG
jgi:hypothetical protein